MKKQLFTVIALLLSVFSVVYAQSSRPSDLQYERGLSKFFKKATLPTSPTVVTAATSYLDFLHLANKSTTLTVKVTIVDASTDCAGGPCTIWPTVTIAPNQVYTAPLYGIQAAGITWSADTASAVDAQIEWRQ